MPEGQVSEMEILNQEPAVAEVPIVEAAAAEVPPAEGVTPPAEGAAPAEGAEPVAAAAPAEPEVEEFPDQHDVFTVKSLAEKAAKNPAFQAMLTADPALKNQLFSTARQAAKLADFKSVFANVDTARTALQLAGEYNKFQSALQSGGRSALEFLAGNDPNVLAPAYLQLVGAYREELYKHARESGDPELTAAVDKIAQFMGDSAGTVAPKEGAAALDPEVARLREENARFKQQGEEAQQQEAQRFYAGAEEAVTSGLASDIKRVLDVAKGNGAALSPYMENMISQAVRAELNQLATQDAAYQQHIKFVYGSTPRTPEGREKIAGAVRGWAKEHLMGLVRKHLSEVSQPALQAQAAKAGKVQQQVATPNPRGGGGVAPPSRPDPAAKVEEWKRTHGGRMPSERDILFDQAFA